MLFTSDWVKLEGHEGYSNMDLQIFFIRYQVQCTSISKQLTNNIQSVSFWFYQNTYKSSPYLPCERHLHKTQLNS